MAEYILQILRSQLMVMFSWGSHNFKRLPDDQGLAFLVNGYKYQGEVRVIYNDGLDLFEVHLADGTTVDMVYVDNLVAIIDTLVERTDNYKERVEAEYGIHAN